MDTPKKFIYNKYLIFISLFHHYISKNLFLFCFVYNFNLYVFNKNKKKNDNKKKKNTLKNYIYLFYI